MASLVVRGMTDFIDELERQSVLTPQLIDSMLSAGGKVTAEIWKESAEKHGLRDTGDMIKSIRPTKPKDMGGIRVSEIYPQGKDRKGVRNAEKAFINNYGTSGSVRKLAATHFADQALEKARDAALDAMLDVFSNE